MPYETYPGNIPVRGQDAPPTFYVNKRTACTVSYTHLTLPTKA